MYVMDNAFTDAHNDVVTKKQDPAQTETDYANKQCDKALRRGHVFPQHRLKSIFVEVVQSKVRQTTHQFMADDPNFVLTELARNASSMGYVSRGKDRATLTAGARKSDGRKRGQEGTVLAMQDTAPSTPATSTGETAYYQNVQVLPFGPRRPQPSRITRPHIRVRTFGGGFA